jgi:hypothetical protein
MSIAIIVAVIWGGLIALWGQFWWSGRRRGRQYREEEAVRQRQSARRQREWRARDELLRRRIERRTNEPE